MKKKITALYTSSEEEPKGLFANIFNNQDEAANDIIDHHKERVDQIITSAEEDETTVEVLKGDVKPFLSFLNKFLVKWKVGDVIKIKDKK